MFASLRSRLWLSYALLILLVIVIVTLGLILSLRDNPLLYRDTVLRINLANAILAARLENQPNLNFNRLELLLASDTRFRQIRLVITDSNGNILLDSLKDGPSLPGFPLPAITDDDPYGVLTYRTTQEQAWFYTYTQLDRQRVMIIAAPRPQLTAWLLLRDDVLRPMVIASIIASIIAILISLGIGNWIALPLKRMVTVTRGVPRGEYNTITIEGPQEVRQLGQSYNDMVQRMAANQQSQRDFLANVTHELKTPLTSIQGFAQAILDDTAQSPEALKQAASVIYNESTRMHRLVLDLLTLSRLETGTADLLRAPLDLAPVLQNVVDKFAIQAAQTKVALRTDIQAPLPTIGDGDRLSQVFTNLVDNALKFSPPGSQALVTASITSDGILIRVVDNGPGIPMEYHTRIFERFFQMDKSRRGGATRGVGLGLPIARQIVIAHGGRIWVESAPGTGSQFFVNLPVRRE